MTVRHPCGVDGCNLPAFTTASGRPLCAQHQGQPPAPRVTPDAACAMPLAVGFVVISLAAVVVAGIYLADRLIIRRFQ